MGARNQDSEDEEEKMEVDKEGAGGPGTTEEASTYEMTTAMNYSDSSETYEKTGSSKDLTDPAPGDFRDHHNNLPALGYG
jgi:hypothetical protein